jgi:hypothetical protein
MSTTIRRLFALALTPIFAASLVVTLLACRVNRTLFEPDFYTGALHRIGAYDFFYDALLPPILERAGMDLARAPSSLGLSAEGLSAKMKRIIPPDILETQVRTAVEGGLPYLAGNTDSFEITVAPDRWVEEGADVFRDLVREPELCDYLLEEMVRAPLQPQWSAFQSGLPFALELTLDDMVEGVKTVCSGPWLAEQVDAVLDGLVPYATGKTESFSVRIRLDGGATAAIQVLRGWLHRLLEGGGYDHLVRGRGVPLLRLLLTSKVRHPYGVSFSDDELATLIALALPREWVKAQLDGGIDSLARYITGRARSFEFSIPLAERADTATVLFAAAVNARGRAAYEGLRECSAIEEQALGVVPAVLPNCRVPGLAYDEVRARAGFDTVAVLREAFAGRFPERIDVTEQDLRAAFEGSEGGITLESVRNVLIHGYAFDELGLRRLLEATSEPDQRAASWERFQDLRVRLRDGVRFTDADLRRALDLEARAALDRTRFWLGFARKALVVLAAVVALLWVGIARLGGRSRESRLLWGGWALLMGGPAVAAVGFGIQTLRGLSTPLIEGLQARSAFTQKLLELRDELFAAFTGPLVVQGTVAALVGLALVVWGIYRIRWGAKALAAH